MHTRRHTGLPPLDTGSADQLVPCLHSREYLWSHPWEPGVCDDGLWGVLGPQLCRAEPPGSWKRGAGDPGRSPESVGLELGLWGHPFYPLCLGNQER